MKWINVKDGLPELLTWPSGLRCSIKVLVFQDNDVYTAELCGNKWRSNYEFQLLHDVSHWMPLPKPPMDEQ